MRVIPKPSAVVAGASAGAVTALLRILREVPAGAPFPIVVVVHLPEQDCGLLQQVFGPQCDLPVREPMDKEPVAPGIWFAPAGYHLLIDDSDDGPVFSLSVDPRVNFSRPSIDVLFESAADVYGKSLVAMVLTGASPDGAAGRAAVRAAGGFVIVQDPATAEVATMPAAAIARARPQLVADLPAIAAFLRDLATTSMP